MTLENPREEALSPRTARARRSTGRDLTHVVLRFIVAVLLIASATPSVVYNLSDELEHALEPLADFGDEAAIEAFYSWSMTR